MAADDTLARALGTTEIYGVSRARFDLLVELGSAGDVRSLRPDLQALAALEARGVIVTAPGDRDGIDCVSRFFAPNVGVDEDPVTGSAHSALAPFWSERLGRTTLVGEQASPAWRRRAHAPRRRPSRARRPGRHGVGGRAAGHALTAGRVRPQPWTSSRTLPTLASAPTCSWAAAASSSGKRQSMTGRSAPDSNSGTTSRVKRRLSAIFSSSGRARSTVPMSVDALGQQLAEVHRGDGAAHQAHLHDGALRGDGVEVAIELVATDDVEHDVETVGHRGDGVVAPGMRRTLEHPVRAEGTARVGLPRRAGDRDRAAERPAQLDGCRADAGRAGMDERGSARREAALQHEGIPRGQEHLGDGGGVGQRHPLRHRDQLALVHHGTRRVAAAADDGHHVIADGDARAPARRCRSRCRPAPARGSPARPAARGTGPSAAGDQPG